MNASRVALVHERLTEIAGSEHVVEQLAIEWPDARLYVPIADDAAVVDVLKGRVEVTGLDRLHRMIGRRSYAPLLPMVPTVLRRRDFGDVDAVIISHHAFALSAVHAAGDIPTVAYVHSPARWAWDPAMRAGEASGAAGKTALAGLAAVARKTESDAAHRITKVVANSTEVAERIRRWWGRESVVVHPPVNTERFVLDPGTRRGDHFLLAGRLVPYKRPDLAVRAARLAGVKLKVAGSGRLQELCEGLAGPETEFLGRVSDATMLEAQRTARALIMPGVEDFGIVPVEAMACGTPVIAVGEGGSLDTVVPGLSGELVDNGSDDAVVERLAAAMRGFADTDYDPRRIADHAATFSQANFRRAMREVVDSVTG
ncbi:glycosyltransferase [Williamsia sterculiae]|uniref:Glycosyltransferase involved in cell wall bisynthesis n=1 Tax=Williamsia sterculiae TaxID=1344003 RepID=A0A1N7CIE3_9NOCA|nr:glycosyltransferase [Williamsia sterculiae]SIR63398.1 Glycosyltransferase involved in cell wall bisynthesis [Williamsia sterculiae]